MGLNVEKGDIKTYLEKKFNAVISIFHVVSYQTSNNDVFDLLNNASRHLNKGGLFLFDVWYIQWYYHYKTGNKNKEN